MHRILVLAKTLIGLSLMNSALGAELESIGSFDFPTSGNTTAQTHFERGVGYLHSFGFSQAQREFKLAQEAQPDFAMAYWGETFTYNHPFIGEWDSQSPQEALQRLGATSQERLAKAPTEREKGFLRAAEAYAFTPGTVGNRRTAWMQAMQTLYSEFPNDDEVAAFTAVSMLAGATVAGDMRERINMRAGAIAMELFKKNENHPGAAHYVIHAFDDPVHAPIALEAATKYADIAPAVAHARHMPTHIFIQHGMWDEVARWNVSAFDAGAALWQRTGGSMATCKWAKPNAHFGGFSAQRRYCVKIPTMPARRTRCAPCGHATRSRPSSGSLLKSMTHSPRTSCSPQE
jgi:hypothetical protein